MTNLEIERKFLLKCLPDIKYDKIYHIEQYYLVEEKGFSDRIRKREDGSKTKYTRTKKVWMGEKTQEETETKLTEVQFDKLKKKTHSMIEKYRHIKQVGDHKWEIDKFENVDIVMAEFEMISDGDNSNEILNFIKNIELPRFITDNLIMEVSDIKSFSNKMLAIKF